MATTDQDKNIIGVPDASLDNATSRLAESILRATIIAGISRAPFRFLRI
jgi:hypothetical protein